MKSSEFQEIFSPFSYHNFFYFMKTLPKATGNDYYGNSGFHQSHSLTVHKGLSWKKCIKEKLHMKILIKLNNSLIFHISLMLNGESRKRI